MYFNLKVCECRDAFIETSTPKAIPIKLLAGFSKEKITEVPNKERVSFCSQCNNPCISKEEAKEIIRELVEKQQKSRGFLTGREIRGLRDQLNMTVREFGSFLDMNSSTISSIENGYQIQTKANDQLIRIRTKQYINRNAPSRKKIKKIFAYMIEEVGTSKLFLNKMMFYVDFWNFKKFGKSVTGCAYVTLQYGPCPDGYHDMLHEMIEDGEITALQGHKFKVNKKPDMTEFTGKEMGTVFDVIRLAKDDRGKKLFKLSHREPGFVETPLYKEISYEKYAKQLKVEELLEEIANK